MEFGLDPRALREPVGRRLVGSYLASLVGDYMVLAAVPIAVASINGGAWAIGAVLAVQAFAVLAGLPAGGLIGDRLPRRTIMIAADLVRFGSQAAVAVLLILGHAALWELLLTQAIHGTATGIFMPSAEAIVPDVVGADGIQPTNGAKQAAWSIAAIVGPALGAAIAAAVGAGWAMAADAATFVLSAALLTGVPASPRKEEPQSIGEQFREALSRRLRNLMSWAASQSSQVSIRRTSAETGGLREWPTQCAKRWRRPVSQRRDPRRGAGARAGGPPQSCRPLVGN